MNKSALVHAIIDDLKSAIDTALAAADEARETATNKENAAENRYDTLGLEAAYLAHGQSERVLQLTTALEAFQPLATSTDIHLKATTGSLVSLEDDSGNPRVVFIGPSAGGLVLNFEGTRITVVTQQSPLGQALVGATCDDEISAAIDGKLVIYTITTLS